VRKGWLWWGLPATALLSAALGFSLRAWLEPGWRGADPAPAPALGKPRPDFRLPDLEGRMHGPGEWDGKVLVVNFWASWCLPCREEIPEFIALQEKYGHRGLRFVGIAIDQAQNARDFSAQLEINYPVLIGGLEAVQVAEAYGNRVGGLPYTVIVSRSGEIVFSRWGRLHGPEAEKQLLRWL